jgi:hypothetical protein
VDILRKEILAIKSMSVEAAADASYTRQGMATFTKLQNQRLDDMHQVLGEQQKEIGTIVHEIRQISENSMTEIGAITFMALELERYIKLHDNIQEFQLGIEDLIQGHLTSKLIDVSILAGLIRNISTDLRKTQRTLCFSTPREILASRNFDFTRYENEIFIRLRIPFSSYDKVNVYRTMLFPLPVTGNQNLTTIMQSFPLHIILYRSREMIGELLAQPDDPVVDIADIKWHRYADQSCLFHIVYDDPEKIKTYCDFSMRKEIIEPSYARLASGVYVLSNFQNVQILCGQDTPIVPVHCGTCLVNFTCGCYVQSTHTILGSKYCSGNHNGGTVLHAVNLIILQSFYDLTNRNFTGSQLLLDNEYHNASSLHLPFFGDNTTKLLNADKSVSYSLQKLVSTLQNDSVVFHNPAEAMLDQLLEEIRTGRSFWTFNTNAWLTWAVCLLYILLISYVIWLYIRTHRNRQQISNAVPLALAHSLLLPKTTALQLRSTIPTPLDFPPSAIIDWITSLQHSEVFLYILILGVLILLIFNFILLAYSFSRRSYVYIDMTSQTSVLMLKLTTLPDATRYFAIHIPPRSTKLVLYSCFLFGILSFKSSPWVLTHSLTHQRKTLPRWLIIWPWQIKMISALLLDTKTITLPLIVHSHEYVYFQKTQTTTNDLLSPKSQC